MTQFDNKLTIVKIRFSVNAYQKFWEGKKIAKQQRSFLVYKFITTQSQSNVKFYLLGDPIQNVETGYCCYFNFVSTKICLVLWKKAQ